MKVITRFLLTLPFLAPGLLLAETKELTGTRAPTSEVCPTPEEAQKKFTVPDGYVVRCFAHEPMVQNPVAMSWDSRGRLWVVELYEYPEGSHLPPAQLPFSGEAKHDQYQPVPENCRGDQPNTDPATRVPRDRVIILEDTDNDGVADKRTVFVQGLNLASGIVCGDDGVYVGQTPHLIHFKDVDGDDKPDLWRVCLTGFGREDTHELLNSFNWGPDGWLYMTHGVFTNSKVRRPGEPTSRGFKFDAGIGRARPISKLKSSADKATTPPWEFELFSDGTSNPWGVDFDPRGNAFVSACVIDHLFHMAPGGLYQRQGGAPENSYAYELLPSIVKHKHFRAAYAGIQIYQGGMYPEDTHGNLFIGNIHDNAIHQEQITPAGATFKASPVRDFLRANNGWFRPVSTQTGPDGYLWVMDWCDKYPCYQNAVANPEGVDRDRGRIWRVVYKGAKTGEASRAAKDLNLSKAPTSELLELLEHPNNWMRRMAKRQLAERKDAAAKAPLEALTLSEKDESIRLHALWTLHASGMLDGNHALADRLASAPHPGLRTWVARLNEDGIISASKASIPWAGGMAEINQFSLLKQLAADSDPGTRAAVAIAARNLILPSPDALSRVCLTVNRPVTASLPEGWKGQALPPMAPQGKAEVSQILETLLKAGAGQKDFTMDFHIWMALEPNLAADPGPWTSWLAQIAPATQPGSLKLMHKAMRRLCDSKEPQNLDHALALLAAVADEKELIISALEGLERGQEAGIIKPSKDFTKVLAALRKSSHEEVQKRAFNLAVLWGDPDAILLVAKKLFDAGAPEPERLAALESLRKVKSPEAITAYNTLLDQFTPLPGNLKLETLRAARDLGGDNTAGRIIRFWKDLQPLQRAALTESLVSREAWASSLLAAVKARDIPAADVPITVVRTLSTHRNADIKKQAADLFGAWRESNADAKALIAAKKKAVMQGEPNMENGKLLYMASCAVCHEFHGGGQKVGPELIGSGRSNLDALLANVIDPNQIIGNGYEAINVTTKDNRLLSGRMVEDAPGHVKLLAIGGAEQTIPRDQIARIENTKQSLMPSGFGALPDEQFRDLIWYVLAPPDEGPLTPEKKAAMSASMDAPKPKAPPRQSTAPNPYAIDWESVSLWNPAWKVAAPEFERTPMKLAEFHGRKNVLLMHPYTEQKPCSLERKVKVEADKNNQLTVTAASHDQGDWELRIVVDNEVIKKVTIGHDGERWHKVEADLRPYAGKEVTVRLEGAANGWALEFVYWGEIELK